MNNNFDILQPFYKLLYLASSIKGRREHLRNVLGLLELNNMRKIETSYRVLIVILEPKSKKRSHSEFQYNP